MASTPRKTSIEKPPIPQKPLASFLEGTSGTQKGLSNKEIVAELKKKIEKSLKEHKMLECNSRLSNRESNILEETFGNFSEQKYDSKNLQEVEVLLIGKTGNGKSALGNTILGYNAFESKSSMSSVTLDASYDVGEWNGYRIKVVDGPGIGDTRMDINEATQVILKAMSEAISLSPHGFHAFLLVVKFGGRFTAEDKLTVDTLKKIFGENFFKKFCILVMTCGDKFEEEADTSFQEWVKEQNNEIFTDLLNECSGRIVLFNNRTQDGEKKKKQLNELFEIIESLKRQNCRYSDEHFSAALETRNILLVESRKNFIEEDIMDEANIIQQKFKVILDGIHMTRSAPFLTVLYQRAEALYKKISDSDMNTGVLSTVLQHVWSIMEAIRDRIKLSENLAKKTAKLRKLRAKQARLHAEELRRQREELEKFYLEGKTEDKIMIEMLQKQIHQINEANKKWDAKEEELEANATLKGENQKEILLLCRNTLQKLKEEKNKTSNANISKSVFTKLKEKLFSKKRL